MMKKAICLALSVMFIPALIFSQGNEEVYKYAKQKPVGLNEVKITEGFWGDIRERVCDVGIPVYLSKFERHGFIDNFRIVAENRMEPKTKGPSDDMVYKELEAMAWFYDDSEYIRELDQWLAGIILSARMDDGYLGTRMSNPLFVKNQGDKRFAPTNRLEFYNYGHFVQAALANYTLTGNQDLLDAAIEFSDLIVGRFAKPDTLPFKMFRENKLNLKYEHPNHEMAMVDMYRITGNKKYLDFALQTYEEYGYFEGEHFNEIWGHAVQENYLEAGAVDVYLETGNQEMFEITTRLWDDMFQKKMYITGGTGCKRPGEAYGDAYVLPNLSSYAETCAAIGLVYWNYRMMLATGDAKYADEMERTLYNGVLGGYGLDGKTYFYQNPMEINNPERFDRSRRREWHACPCCAPNVLRTFGGISQFFYTQNSTGVQVNLYGSSELTHTLPDGNELKISQVSNYPWDSKVKIAVEAPSKAKGTLKLRIPQWCRGATLEIDGSSVNAKTEKGYMIVHEPWALGDTLLLNLPMQARVVEGNPKVESQINKIAIMRGPLVYCMEEVDNKEVYLNELKFGDKLSITEQFEPQLLKGVTTLNLPAYDATEPVTVKLIPYYAWSNREPGMMKVWLPKW